VCSKRWTDDLTITVSTYHIVQYKVLALQLITLRWVTNRDGLRSNAPK